MGYTSLENSMPYQNSPLPKLSEGERGSKLSDTPVFHAVTQRRITRTKKIGRKPSEISEQTERDNEAQQPRSGRANTMSHKYIESYAHFILFLFWFPVYQVRRSVSRLPGSPARWTRVTRECKDKYTNQKLRALLRHCVYPFAWLRPGVPVDARFAGGSSLTSFVPSGHVRVSTGPGPVSGKKRLSS